MYTTYMSGQSTDTAIGSLLNIVSTDYDKLYNIEKLRNTISEHLRVTESKFDTRTGKLESDKPGLTPSENMNRLMQRISFNHNYFLSKYIKPPIRAIVGYSYQRVSGNTHVLDNKLHPVDLTPKIPQTASYLGSQAVLVKLNSLGSETAPTDPIVQYTNPDPAVIPTYYRMTDYPGVRAIEEYEPVFNGAKDLIGTYTYWNTLFRQKFMIPASSREAWEEMVGHDRGIKGDINHYDFQVNEERVLKVGLQTPKTFHKEPTFLIPLEAFHSQGVSSSLLTNSIDRNHHKIKAKFARVGDLIKAYQLIQRPGSVVSDPLYDEVEVPVNRHAIKRVDIINELYYIDPVLACTMARKDSCRVIRTSQTHTECVSEHKSMICLDHLTHAAEFFICGMQPKSNGDHFKRWHEFRTFDKTCLPIPSLIDDGAGGFSMVQREAEFQVPRKVFKNMNIRHRTDPLTLEVDPLYHSTYLPFYHGIYGDGGICRHAAGDDTHFVTASHDPNSKSELGNWFNLSSIRNNLTFHYEAEEGAITNENQYRFVVCTYFLNFLHQTGNQSYARIAM